MAGKVPVLHRLQAGYQQFGHFVQLHQPTLFLLLAVQRGNAGRIQTQPRRRVLATGGGHLGHTTARKSDLRHPRGDRAVHVVEAAAGDFPAATVARIAAGPHAIAGVVAGGPQLHLQSARVHRQAGCQFQGPPIDPSGQLPAQLVKALAHLVIEVERVRDQEAKPQTDAGQDQGGQQAAPAWSGLGDRLHFVFVVIDSGHGMGQ